MDELSILGGLENVIPHRSLTGSPIQTTQRVSGIRTQAGMPLDAASLPPQRSTSYSSSDPQLSHNTSQDFDFSGLDNHMGVPLFNDQGMPSSTLPTYEQIMGSGYASRFSPYTHATSMGYPSEGSQRQSSSAFPDNFGQFSQGPSNPEMLGGEGPGTNENVWRSFVGGLMSGPVETVHPPF